MFERAAELRPEDYVVPGMAGAAYASLGRRADAQLAYRRRELEMLGRDAASDAVAASLRQRVARLRPRRLPRDNR